MKAEKAMQKICKFEFLGSLDAIPQRAKIAIYGAGGRGHKILECVNKYRNDIEVICFIDDSILSSPTGYSVLTYEVARLRFKWDLILVASIHVRSILEKLSLNEMAIVLTNSDSDGISKSDKINFIDNIFYYKKYKSNLNFLANGESRRTYSQLYRKRMDRDNYLDLIFISKLFKAEQYLDYIQRDKIKIAFDAGVHDGYSSLQFIKSFSNLQMIFGFDIFDFSLKSGNYSKELMQSGKFQLIIRALQKQDNENLLALFNEKNPSASKLASKFHEGAHIVKSITIDKFCEVHGVKFDFIKFDIEGAELDALEGAMKSLKEFRPQIAISIYHTKSDFIQIPYYLMKNLSNYSFYLSHYSLEIYETVLYAIPNEISR